MTGFKIITDMVMSIFAGRNSKYWYRARDMAIYRDSDRKGGKCKVCGGRNKLEVHHLEGWAKNRFLRFTLSNLITLCRGCHRDDKDSYHSWMGGTGVPSTSKTFWRWMRTVKKKRK